MTTLSLAKLNKVLHALVARQFATDADVSQLFELQRVAYVTEFPPNHLILNFQVAEADHDRAIKSRSNTEAGSGTVLWFQSARLRDRSGRDR